MSKETDDIKNILFPPPKRINESNHYISYDAIDNLEGALESLKYENVDPISIKTLEKIQQQLIRVRDYLEKKNENND